MLEKQSYELLLILPLTATDEELRRSVEKIEERLKTAGASVQGSAAIQKGRLAYAIKNVRQGSYYTLQFELDPQSVAQLQRDLALGGEILRSTITRVDQGFKPFVSSPAKTMRGKAGRDLPAHASQWQTGLAAASPAALHSPAPLPSPDKIDTPTPTATTPGTPPTPAPAPTVTMEELDRRLEQILGEN